VDGFVEGLSLTEKELLSALERHGIKRIEPLEEKFNPQFHEAMYEVPSEDVENGTIVQVVEVGYVIHDRLLRPAKVGIAKSAISNAMETPDENDTTDGSE
jgi:molecular chaperone GrpE